MTRDDYINITYTYNKVSLQCMTNVSGHNYMEYMYRGVSVIFLGGGGEF